MVKQVQVTIPNSELLQVLAFLHGHPEAQGIASFGGDDTTLVIFRTQDKHTDGLVGAMERRGVTEHGRIDILTLAGTKPRLVSNSKRRRYRVHDRMSLEEIEDSIDSMNHLTFNYLGFITVAAMISCVGLATDSAAVVVASMLVSPLMGPIVAISYGLSMRDWRIIRKGLRNEVIGFFLTFFVGMLWGCGAFSFPDMWGQGQQTSRGNISGVYAGIALAIPSGAGVALATSGGGISVLVGVAISAALLPPVCLSGSYLTYGIILRYWKTQTASNDALVISFFAAVLFLVNFVLIVVMALIFFRLKKMSPKSLQHRGINEGNAAAEVNWLAQWDEPIVDEDEALTDDDFLSTANVNPYATDRRPLLQHPASPLSQFGAINP